MKKEILKLPKLIGKNIKKLRLINNLTLEELSNRSQVTVSAISNIENGKTVPRVLSLRKLLISMNYGLGLFASKLINEQPEFNPDRLISKKDDFLLLYGNKKSLSNKVWLIRPINQITDREILEIEILPEKKLFPENIIINSIIWGIVKEGELLIEFENDEIWIKSGEEFQFKGEKLHNYRNTSIKNCKVTMIISEAVF